MLEEKLRGVNLAGWLVLEPWVTPSLFASTGTFDELNLASSLGSEKFEALIKHHRDTFITEEDFAAIEARGFNAVRLPIAWSVFGKDGPRPGVRLASISYVDTALDWAKEHNLKVLLCMANTPSGNGAREDQELLLGPTGAFRAPGLEVIRMLTERYKGHDAFFGIEPLDEPIAERWIGFSVQPGIPLRILKNFYHDCYEVIRKVSPGKVAVVFSAAGAPGAWRHFMHQDCYVNVYLDMHMYHYGDQNDTRDASMIRHIVRGSKKELNKALRSKKPVLVGEWSAALPVSVTSPTLEGRVAQERIYASAQIASFKKTQGWFFQTWKTETKLSAWDARVALSSFERSFFSQTGW